VGHRNTSPGGQGPKGERTHFGGVGENAVLEVVEGVELAAEAGLGAVSVSERRGSRKGTVSGVCARVAAPKAGAIHIGRCARPHAAPRHTPTCITVHRLVSSPLLQHNKDTRQPHCKTSGPPQPESQWAPPPT